MSCTKRYETIAAKMQNLTGCPGGSSASIVAPVKGSQTSNKAGRKGRQWFVNDEGHPIFIRDQREAGTWKGPFTAAGAAAHTGIPLAHLHTDTFEVGDAVIYNGNDARMTSAASAKVVGLRPDDQIGRAYDVEFTYDPPEKLNIFGKDITVHTQNFSMYPHEMKRSKTAVSPTQ